MSHCLILGRRESDARGDVRRRRRGFSLVELLVVIGVIAVLMGILMPALTKARESANRTKCLANLRMLATSLVMYSQNSKDWLPINNPSLVVNDYVGTNDLLVRYNERFIKSPGTFHCPSDQDDVPKSIDTADYVLPNSARVSYEFYSVWWTPEGAPRITKVKDAPLVWDLDGGRPLMKRQNHGRTGGNVAFSDGHAEWQPREDWDGPNWPKPAQKYYPQPTVGGGP